MGTDVFGNKDDSTQLWGIKFDHIKYELILLTTNNLQEWTILPKSTFTPGVWTTDPVNIRNNNLQNIRSSMALNGPDFNPIFYRNGVVEDPQVNLDGDRVLYKGDSNTLDLGFAQAPYNGVSMWIRQSGTAIDQ